MDDRSDHVIQPVLRLAGHDMRIIVNNDKNDKKYLT